MNKNHSLKYRLRSVFAAVLCVVMVLAGLPVAVNINCHVTRHKTEVL